MRGKSRVALLLLTVGLSLVWAGSGASAAPGEKLVPPGKERAKPESQPETDPGLLAQGKIVGASDRIQRLVDEQGYSAFAGLALDGAAAELYWKGSLPGDVSRLVDDLRAEGNDVRVVITKYSLAELDAEAQRIAGLDPTSKLIGITGAGPLGDYSGIMVSVASTGDISRAKLAIASPYPLQFQVRRPALPILSRWDDTSPFWGGAAIDHLDNAILRTYRYCTTGWPTDTSTGADRMITARHCGTDMDWRTPTGDRFVGHTANGSASRDATTLSGASYGTSIYIGAWNSSSSRSIGSSGNPADESQVFVSGSWSGYWVVRVKEVNQYINLNGTTVGPGFWTLDEQGRGSVGQGDSGGPSGNNNSNATKVIGRGMLDAIDTSGAAPCQGKTGRQCSVWAFSVNLSSILSTLGLTLHTV